MNNELSLISKILETKDITNALNSKVGSCFLAYGDIYKFIQDYYLKFKAVPPVEVVTKKFPHFTPGSSDATLEFYIDEVTNDYLRMKLGETIKNAAYKLEDNPREVLDYIFAKTTTLGHQTNVVKDVNLAEDYWMRVESLRERANSKGEEGILGIPSTIPPLDFLFGGWQKGDLIVMMGYTGMGKSFLAMYFAMQAWKFGYSPLYVSLEMDDLQVGYRLDTLLGEGKLSNTQLMNARDISADSYEEWTKETYTDKPPFHVVTNESMEEVNQFTIQTKIEQYKPSIVIVDYISLCTDARNGRTETERHRNLSKDFKRMAVRYSIPIIAIAAVTMEDGHSERAPELNEIAWSKQTSFDVDLMLSLFKEGQIVTIEAKKSRRSDLFATKLNFDFDSGIVTEADGW